MKVISGMSSIAAAFVLAAGVSAGLARQINSGPIDGRIDSGRIDPGPIQAPPQGRMIGYSPLMASIREGTGATKINSLRAYLETGGQFDPQAREPQGGLNEAMYVLRQTGLTGLRLFLDHQGRFDSSARSYAGQTEAMFVARYGGAQALKLFVSHGGRLQPGAKDNSGKSEADYAGMHGAAAAQTYRDLAGIGGVGAPLPATQPAPTPAAS